MVLTFSYFQMVSKNGNTFFYCIRVTKWITEVRIIINLIIWIFLSLILYENFMSTASNWSLCFNVVFAVTECFKYNRTCGAYIKNLCDTKPINLYLVSSNLHTLPLGFCVTLIPTNLCIQVTLSNYPFTLYFMVELSSWRILKYTASVLYMQRTNWNITNYLSIRLLYRQGLEFSNCILWR